MANHEKTAVLDGRNWSELTPERSDTCERCEHFQGGHDDVNVCVAFPDGIPDEIWSAYKGHRIPYPGDNGIQFTQPDYTSVDFSKLKLPDFLRKPKV